MDTAWEEPAKKELNVGDTLGPYTLVRELPPGGMARVFVAQSRKSGERVAIKVALAGKGSFLRDETTFLKVLTVRDPHIIQLLPITLEDGRTDYKARDPRSGDWYCVMEYMEGGSLADWMDRRKRIPFAKAVQVVRQIGLALDAAHSANLLHLDVKPNNILFRDDPEKGEYVSAVLTDFGIARLVRHDVQGESTSSSGTPQYASPEQAVGMYHEMASERPPDVPPSSDLAAMFKRQRQLTVASAPSSVGPASDLFSLAVILYEMLAGKLPFSPSTGTEDELTYLERVICDPPSLPIPDMPRDLTPVLERALSKDITARYQSGREFARELKKLLPPPPRRRNVLVPLIGIVGLMMGLFLGFLISQSGIADSWLATPTVTPMLSMPLSPVPLFPPPGVELPQSNESVPGCPDSQRMTVWQFKWYAASPPAGRVYQIVVEQENAGAALVDESNLDSTEYVYRRCGNVSDSDQPTLWRWRVRAQDKAGQWGDWSETHSFTVAGRPR